MKKAKKKNRKPSAKKRVRRSAARVVEKKTAALSGAKIAAKAVPGAGVPAGEAEAPGDLARLKQKAKGIEQLIALGKEKGFLTYDDINKMLPGHVTSSEEIEDVLVTLTSQ